MVQPDIKRVVAYSTCSQLGYMFAAAGVSAYGAAIFHLFTHAFFKGLLFLCCGSVIHAMGGEQDMRRMGGLWRKTPITYVTMWIGALSLSALPFFSGYYSKDTILEAAWASGIGGRPLCLGPRHRRGVDDRLLHLARHVHDLPRRAARRRRGDAPRA